MTFHEAMRRQNEKLQKYLCSGGVAGIPLRGALPRVNPPVDSHNGMDAPINDVLPESQDVLMDIARAILSGG